MKKIKLLITDDQELIRESLHIVLSMEEDFEIIGLAENGKHAIEICEKNIPDMILMDIEMPIMNGINATEQIKKRWPNIKIVILTTFQETEYVMDVLRLGAEGYLLKAIHPNELKAGIRLIHHGGTLLPQNLAKMIFSSRQDTFINKEPKSELSFREQEVLQGIIDGLTNRSIAEKLGLTEGTVKNYVSSIYSKLEVGSRVEVVNKVLSQK
jgi:DNA-binding NarL/FixJ family response regulator